MHYAVSPEAAAKIAVLVKENSASIAPARPLKPTAANQALHEKHQDAVKAVHEIRVSQVSVDKLEAALSEMALAQSELADLEVRMREAKK